MAFRHLIPAGLALLLAGCSQSPQKPSPPPTSSRPPARPAPPSSASAPHSPPSTKTDDLMQQAVASCRSGNLVAAIGQLEQLVAHEPTNRTALAFLAELLQERAIVVDRPQSSQLYLRAAQLMRTLRATYPNLDPVETSLLRTVLYNEACTYAVERKPERALDTLAEAIDAGFLRPEHLRTDDELDSLRNTERFRELEQKVERLARVRAREQARKRLAETRTFPFHFELPGLDGRTVMLDEIKGKVTIVDLWGTWCPPCRREVPHLISLYQKYHEQGLEIVGINYENVSKRDERDTIARFVKENGIPYRCLIGDAATQNQIPNFQGFPTTLFLDRTGTVRALMMGFEPDLAPEMEAIVELLLAQGPSAPVDTP